MPLPGVCLGHQLLYHTNDDVAWKDSLSLATISADQLPPTLFGSATDNMSAFLGAACDTLLGSAATKAGKSKSGGCSF